MALRIAVCNSQVPFERGGAEMLADALVAQLQARGHEAILVQIPQQWQPRQEILNNYLMWRLVNLEHSYDQRPIDRVIALKYPAYAVRHAHKTTWLVHQLRQAYELYGTPYSFLDNTDEDRHLRKVVHRMDGRMLAESRRLCAISRNVADRVRRFNGLSPEVVYPPPPLDGQYRSGDYGDYVMSVSRLVPIKRVHLLIEALTHTENQVACCIVGRGPEEDGLRRLAQRLHVAERVRFMGFVPDEALLELYANALAVFYAPVDEDYGFATVEAMKAHRPVLTTEDSGGVLEFVTEGETGFICRPSDAAGLAERIDKLFLYRRLAREIGDRGYERVRDIAWDTAIARLLDA